MPDAAFLTLCGILFVGLSVKKLEVYIILPLPFPLQRFPKFLGIHARPPSSALTLIFDQLPENQVPGDSITTLPAR